MSDPNGFKDIKKKYLNSDKPSAPNPKRFNKQCKDCKTYFFGDSQQAANHREAKHHFDGKCSGK